MEGRRVFVTGGTGALGRELVPRLVARGWTVAGTARSERAAEVLRRLGGEPRQADLFDAGALARAADGCEVVVHAATSIPTSRIPKPAEFVLNDRIRTEGVVALAEAATRTGARAFVHQSTLWCAQPPDGSPFAEDAPPSPDPLQEPTWRGERLVEEAAARAGFGAVVLRCGWFYGPGSAHTRQFADDLRRRRLPVVGRGDGVKAMLHLADAGEAFAVAVEAEASGVFHVVDDGPVPFGEYLDGFAALLGAPRPRRVPAWIARLATGRYAAEFVTSSMRTTADRWKAATGWAPAFPTWEQGLADCLRAWSAEAG